MRERICWCIFMALLIFQGQTYAETSNSKTFTLLGKVLASPCVVEQQSVNVNLGDAIKMSQLSEAGSFTDWVSFDIRIYNCPLQTTVATISFDGTADPVSPELRYQNSGTATGVSVELQAVDGTPLGDGKSMNGEIVNQEYTWNLRARAWTESGGVKAGTIASVISATLTYQ